MQVFWDVGLRRVGLRRVGLRRVGLCRGASSPQRFEGSNSPWTSRLWRWRNHDLSKRRKSLTPWSSVTSHKTCLPYRHARIETEKNNEKPQNILCPALDSNHAPPKYKLQLLPTDRTLRGLVIKFPQKRLVLGYTLSSIIKISFNLQKSRKQVKIPYAPCRNINNRPIIEKTYEILLIYVVVFLQH